MSINEVHDDIWVVGLMKYDLACFDLETRVLEPLNNPFEPKVLPMCPVRSVTYVSGPDHKEVARPEGTTLELSSRILWQVCHILRSPPS